MKLDDDLQAKVDLLMGGPAGPPSSSAGGIGDLFSTFAGVGVDQVVEIFNNAQILPLAKGINIANEVGNIADAFDMQGAMERLHQRDPGGTLTRGRVLDREKRAQFIQTSQERLAEAMSLSVAARSSATAVPRSDTTKGILEKAYAPVDFTEDNPEGVEQGFFESAASGLGEFFKAPAGDMARTAAEIGIPSFMTFAPAFLAWLVNPVLGAGVTFGTEKAASLSEGFRSIGVDPQNTEQILSALQNPDSIRELEKFGMARGAAITLFQMLGMKTGGVNFGKVFTPGLKSRVAQQAVNAPTQIAVQSLYEGAGEATAGIASTGKADGGEVAMEMIGGAFGAPVEVLVGVQRARKKVAARVRKPEEEILLKDIQDAAQEDPSINEILQSLGMTDEQLAAMTPERRAFVAERVEEARQRELNAAGLNPPPSAPRVADPKARRERLKQERKDGPAITEEKRVAKIVEGMSLEPTGEFGDPFIDPSFAKDLPQKVTRPDVIEQGQATQTGLTAVEGRDSASRGTEAGRAQNADLTDAERRAIQDELGVLPESLEHQRRLRDVLRAQEDRRIEGKDTTPVLTESGPRVDADGVPVREGDVAPVGPTSSPTRPQDDATIATGTSDRPFKADFEQGRDQTVDQGVRSDSDRDPQTQAEFFEGRANEQANAARDEQIDDLMSRWEQNARAREEAKARAESSSRRAEDKYSRAADESVFGENAADPDQDGIYDTDEFGYVRSDRGGPVRFASQIKAARYIVDVLNKGGSKRQVFDIANHPFGQDAFTVQEINRADDQAQANEADQTGQAETPRKPLLGIPGPRDQTDSAEDRLTAFKPTPLRKTSQPTLLGFLRKLGIKDLDNSVTKTLDGAFPGLVRKDGVQLDLAAFDAWVAGYTFPGVDAYSPGTNQLPVDGPTVNDLINLLDSHSRGDIQRTVDDQAIADQNAGITEDNRFRLEDLEARARSPEFDAQRRAEEDQTARENEEADRLAREVIEDDPETYGEFFDPFLDMEDIYSGNVAAETNRDERQEDRPAGEDAEGASQTSREEEAGARTRNRSSTTEQTDQGEQFIFEGQEVKDRDRVAADGRRPLRGGDERPGGLFDAKDDSRQTDIEDEQSPFLEDTTERAETAAEEAAARQKRLNTPPEHVQTLLDETNAKTEDDVRFSMDALLSEREAIHEDIDREPSDATIEKLESLETEIARHIDALGWFNQTPDERAASAVRDTFYSNPISDPRVWKNLGETIARIIGVDKNSLDRWADGIREDVKSFTDKDTASGMARDAGSAGTSIGRGLARLVRITAWTNDAVIRAVGSKIARAGEKIHPVVQRLADMFFATALGRSENAVPQTYQEAVQAEFYGTSARLAKALEPFENLTSKEIREAHKQIIRKIRSGRILKDGGSIDKAAAAIRDILNDQLEYMRKAGIEIGKIKNYFPRVMDMGRVLKAPEKFRQKAMELAQRHMDMTLTEAKAFADSWLEQITLSDLGFSAPNGNDFVSVSAGQRANFEKLRKLPPAADTVMEEFYINNLAEALPLYFRRAARRSEWSRRMGPNLEVWKEIKAEMMEAGATAMDIHDVVRALQSSTGSLPSPTSRFLTFSSFLRTLNSLTFLDHATISSLSEPAVAASRTGNAGDALTAYAWTIRSIVARLNEGIFGVNPDDKVAAATALAEDLNLIPGLQTDMLLEQRVDGETQGRFAQKILRGFFKGIGLHDFTEATRIASMRIGQQFLKRISTDIVGETRIDRKKSADVLAKELGIPTDRQAEFAKWVLDNNGSPDIDAINVNGEMGQFYRTAVMRFVSQVIMGPTGSNKPRMATHPYFGLFYQLTGFLYAFQVNVVNRSVRGTFKALNPKGKLNAADRLRMLAPLSLLSLAVLAQVPLVDLRDWMLDNPARDPKKKKRTDASKWWLATSRSGALGVADLPINLVTGIKYRKDPATALLGPELGLLSELFSSTIAAILSNSDKTNTAERRMSKLVYDVAINPLLNMIGSRIPGTKTSRSFIGAGIIQGAGHPAVREGLVSEVAGKPGWKTRKPKGSGPRRYVPRRARQSRFKAQQSRF